MSVVDFRRVVEPPTFATCATNGMRAAEGLAATFAKLIGNASTPEQITHVRRSLAVAVLMLTHQEDQAAKKADQLGAGSTCLVSEQDFKEHFDGDDCFVPDPRD